MMAKKKVERDCEACRGLPSWSRAVQWAAHRAAAAIEDVCIDHGGGDVAMAQQLLDGADIVAVFNEMCCETVAQRVTAALLGDIGLAYRCFHRFLHGADMTMMAAAHAAARIDGKR